MMKFTATRIFQFAAALALVVAILQMHDGGINGVSPAPAFAQNVDTATLLFRAAKPRVDILPNNRGVRIRWAPLTETNHASIAPTDADDALPSHFEVRREVNPHIYFSSSTCANTEPADGIGSNRTEIVAANILNDATQTRLKVIDTGIEYGGAAYHYCLVVHYPNGHSVLLRPSRTIYTPTASIVDLKMETFQVADKMVDGELQKRIRIRWKPLGYAVSKYQVWRVACTHPFPCTRDAFSREMIAEVDHDSSVRRLRATDTALASGWQVYYTMRASGDDGVFSLNTSLGEVEIIEVE